MPHKSLIGRSPRRVDALDKVTGKARYADDLTFPKMLHGILLRSPHARAKILSIDVSKAKAVAGVKAILTGPDLPLRYGVIPSSQDEPALAQGETRYVGEPVAAVAALDEETAQCAAKLIDVEYEPLEPKLTIEDGERDKTVSYEFGAVPKTPAQHRRTDLFFYEGNTHLPMEEHSATAIWKGDKLTLHSCSQTPFHLRQIVAQLFKLPQEKVRVIVPSLGGGFGGKLDPFSHEICAAKLSQLTKRPVKFTLTREEVFYCHRGRHPSLMENTSTWTKDGKLLDLRFKAVLDGGAYGSFGVVCTYYHGALQPTTYDIPFFKFDGARMTTNKPPCGPKRGHGIPQPRCSLEVHLDKVAEDLGINPIDLRLKNLTPADSVTVNRLKVTSSGLRRCVETVERASQFKRRYGKLPAGKGLGFALGSYLSGAGVPIYWNDEPHSRIRIEVDARGRITIFSGATDIGQGSDNLVVMIVAEILGVEPGRLNLVAADTELTPLDLGSYSSRVTYMAGNAAKQAAERLRDEVCRLAGDRKAPFEKSLKAALRKKKSITVEGSYRPPPKIGRHKGSGVGVSPAYSFSACVAEVDVDLETGFIKVEKITFAHDIGRAIHRASVEGQVEGGVHMGLGEALMEEVVYHPNGLHRKTQILDYKMPSALEIPELDIHLIESNDPGGPFGAKEVGQGPLIPVIPAVANAIYDAVGVRIDSTPYTPEKILAALNKKAEGRTPRVGPDKFPEITFKEPTKVPPYEEERAAQAGEKVC
ncbi:MAG: molybdopterin cofactor-binding domain-containing protein [Elusimicrobiota bacterium]